MRQPHGGDLGDAPLASVPVGTPLAIHPSADLAVVLLSGDAMEEFDRVTSTSVVGLHRDELGSE